MRMLVAVIASSVFLGQIAVCNAAQPSDVLGTWGAFDEKSGTCTPDSIGVAVTATKFTVHMGGHEINVRPVGQAACSGNRCTVNTTATRKSRTWTWIFKTADTAAIEGYFPHDMAVGGFLEFKHMLKKGCP